MSSHGNTPSLFKNLYDLAENLTKETERLKVLSIQLPGENPHLYYPARKKLSDEILALQKKDKEVSAKVASFEEFSEFVAAAKITFEEKSKELDCIVKYLMKYGYTPESIGAKPTLTVTAATASPSKNDANIEAAIEELEEDLENIELYSPELSEASRKALARRQEQLTGPPPSLLSNDQQSSVALQTKVTAPCSDLTGPLINPSEVCKVDKDDVQHSVVGHKDPDVTISIPPQEEFYSKTSSLLNADKRANFKITPSPEKFVTPNTRRSVEKWLDTIDNAYQCSPNLIKDIQPPNSVTSDYNSISNEPNNKPFKLLQWKPGTGISNRLTPSKNFKMGIVVTPKKSLFERLTQSTSNISPAAGNSTIKQSKEQFMKFLPKGCSPNLARCTFLKPTLPIEPSNAMSHKIAGNEDHVVSKNGKMLPQSNPNCNENSTHNIESKPESDDDDDLEEPVLSETTMRVLAEIRAAQSKGLLPTADKENLPPASNRNYSQQTSIDVSEESAPVGSKLNTTNKYQNVSMIEEPVLVSRNQDFSRDLNVASQFKGISTTCHLPGNASNLYCTQDEFQDVNFRSPGTSGLMKAKSTSSIASHNRSHDPGAHQHTLHNFRNAESQKTVQENDDNDSDDLEEPVLSETTMKVLAYMRAQGNSQHYQNSALSSKFATVEREMSNTPEEPILSSMSQSHLARYQVEREMSNTPEEPILSSIGQPHLARYNSSGGGDLNYASQSKAKSAADLPSNASSLYCTEDELKDAIFKSPGMRDLRKTKSTSSIASHNRSLHQRALHILENANSQQNLDAEFQAENLDESSFVKPYHPNNSQNHCYLSFSEAMLQYSHVAASPMPTPSVSRLRFHH